MNSPEGFLPKKLNFTMQAVQVLWFRPFINGKHDGTWALEDTLTRVTAVASTGAGVKQINRSAGTGKETDLKV